MISNFRKALGLKGGGGEQGSATVSEEILKFIVLLAFILIRMSVLFSSFLVCSFVLFFYFMKS